MKVQFVKMSGAGNDFVVVDNRSGRIKNGGKTARLLCDRRWGIGADGLLLLQKSRRADYRMMYYNADGSYGGMCGNGGRCIASYAVTHRIASKKHTFEALNYVYRAAVNPRDVTLFMRDPQDLSLEESLTLDSRHQRFSFVDTGAPHVVVFLDELANGAKNLDGVQLGTLGPQLRYHPRFAPGGTNVNIVEPTGAKCLSIRTYERGVEDETLACGTGSIAAALIASRLRKMKPPIKVRPRSRVPLTIDFSNEGGRTTNVRLTGPAVAVFEGEIEI